MKWLVFLLFPSLTVFIIGLGIFIGIILIMRLIGAWMLRINDVVNELEKVNSKLTKIEGKLDKDS
jgi:uncharacterized membrane-anchored protein YhcB (DUF1043 family)